MKITLVIISIILLGCGIYISWEFFGIIAEYFTYKGNGELKMDATGQVGDFIGGIVGTIFSLAGFVMLLLTFRQQNDSFKEERFESNFFELIKFHRENINELKYETFEMDEDDQGDSNLRKNTFDGRKVFIAIFKQFVQCSNECKQFFDLSDNEIYEPAHLNWVKELAKERGIKISPKFLAKVDIVYSIVFYGASADGVLVLKKIFKNKYKDSFVDSILRYVSLKPTMDSPLWFKWRKLSRRNSFVKRKKIIDEIYKARKSKKNYLTLQQIEELLPDEEIIWNYTNRYTKYYGGHQFRLGHYFRHFYQSVNFVNDQKFLSYKRKYNYVKTLRAQLSTYEQALLFLNSLSSMGNVWELMPDYRVSILPWIDSKNKKNKQLITKYNLIKNLPGDTLYGIQFRDFYPEVQYELDMKQRNNKGYY